MEEQQKENPEFDSNHLDPEYLMDSAGSWNRYQAFQTSCFAMIVLFCTYGHYLPILYLYTPEHHCFISGGEEWNLTQSELRSIFIPRDKNESSQYDKCTMFDVNITQVLNNGSRESDPNWPLIKCRDGWHYELEGYYNSVASEFDFVCENSWKGPFSDTFYFIGSAIGMLLNGWIGDHFGRYWSIVINNCSMCIFGLILGFSPNFIFFTVIRFIMGTLFLSGMTSFFVITMESVSKNRRTFIGNFALGFGIFIGGLIMPGLLYLLKDWRLANHAMFAQGILTFLLPFTTHESIHWLLERGQYQKAAKTLEEIAKFNGKDLDKSILADLNNMKIPDPSQVEGESKSTKKKHTSVLRLLKTPRLRRHFLIMLVVWSFTTILFESFLRSMKTIDVHIYYSFIISSFLEFLAGIVVIWAMECFGRRWMYMVFCCFSGIAMFVSAYIKETTDDATSLLILSMLTRYGSSTVINVGMQFQFEICPTDLRSRGSGIILFSGGISAFLSPFIIHAGTIYSILPELILGSLALSIGIMALILPETANTELPANADEAEGFGRHDNFFYVPILKNREKKKT